MTYVAEHFQSSTFTISMKTVSGSLAIGAALKRGNTYTITRCVRD